MLKPRWRKVFRDIWQNKGRVTLVVGAIALGIFSMAWWSSAYGILSRELNDNYVATNPASAILYMDEVSPDLVDAIQARPGIDQAEAVGKAQGRIWVDDQWITFDLFTRANFENTLINQLTPEGGAFPPPRGEIVLERAALPVADVEIGDTIQIQMANQQLTLPVAGTLHDISLTPAWQESRVYGYAMLETLTDLNIPTTWNEVHITVSEKLDDESHIRDVALETSTWLETQGYRVFRVEVPPPLEHPNQNQMESLMLLLGGFGTLVFLLSTVLVTNMMSAFLAGQIRQIAVMKAIGAGRGQILRLYASMVLILCMLAAFAFPIGIWAGKLTVDFVAFMLNFNITSYAIPHSILLLQIILSFFVPLLTSAYPIYKGTHTTVYDAFNGHGIAQNTFGESGLTRLMMQVRGVSRPLLLSIRNTFRKRGRLLLTFSTLAIGGALFMTALNVRASLLSSIDGKYERLNYDVTLTFNELYPTNELEAVALATKGVVYAEAWGRASSTLIEADGTSGNTFVVLAPPVDTPLLNLQIIDGAWLTEDINNGIVINHNLLSEHPALQVGDVVTLSIQDQAQQWRIIGIVREPASPPMAYMTGVEFERITGLTGQAQSLFIVTQDHDEEALIAAKQNLETSFAASGISISSNLNSFDSRKIVEDHAVLITSFLIMAAILSLLVGGLGLMTTMGINVLERTRELGVMRAIGASNHAILRIILGEGVAIGFLSWLLATTIVIPLSYAVAQMLGQTLLETSLDFALDPFGFVIWLGVVVTFSIIASLLPAWNATRLTVRNVLAYE